ncbi:hypothetical protein T12_2606 [Trichinella patagoniensis]|uniref:Uncharacterized protein n=1 Tax=Trichinella patagoniensis TaxID=990121 RepID=A0A0V1AB33_9BILA|nr:hypothetical protein T12_2606 [Trichinella patagoniensis]
MVNDYLCPYKGVEQQSRSAQSSSPQYHLQFRTELSFIPWLPFCSYMIHIKQPVNHEWSANNIVQDECTMQSMRKLLNNW